MRKESAAKAYRYEIFLVFDDLQSSALMRVKHLISFWNSSISLSYTDKRRIHRRNSRDYQSRNKESCYHGIGGIRSHVLDTEQNFLVFLQESHNLTFGFPLRR